MKIFTRIGQGVNIVGGGIVKTGVHLTGALIGTKFPEAGKYIKEVGDTVVHSSQTVISNAGQFVDGTATGLYQRRREIRKGMGGCKDSVFKHG